MCRFLLYLGPDELLSTVVTNPDHGMIQQAAKAHCNITPVNADGFGIAWYVPSISPIPAFFKDVSPAWSNHNLKQVARVTKSHCIFAHVRAASQGHIMQTNCHPFTFRNLTFMHNGTVPHYKSLKRKMQDTVSDRAYAMIQGTTDSEMMFAMFITNYEKLLDECEGDDDTPYSDQDHTHHMADAMRMTLHQVHRLVLDYEKSTGSSPDTHVDDEYVMQDGADVVTPVLPYTNATGRINLAVTDGRSAVTCRYTTSHPSTAHTLYYTRGTKLEYKGKKCCVSKGPESQPMAIVSSEPLGDQYECEVVPVNHQVVIGPNHFSVDPCNS